MVHYLTTSEESGSFWHSHTSSVPPALSLRSHCTCWSIYGPQSSSSPFAKGQEPPIGPAASHLTPDRWIWSSTTQHWSGKRLSSSAESSNVEHARRNGNVHHRTSHAMILNLH